jgi:dolichol-phosphate mannosyltransferase
MLARPDEGQGEARVSDQYVACDGWASGHLSQPRKTTPAPLITVVIPTFNESDNVPVIVERIAAALRDADWEIVFVDDNSPDGTSTIAKNLGMLDARVRCLRRVGRRGLAGAFLEGALASQAQFVAAIDGDLQHDERLLPHMLQVLQQGQADIVIASRYVAGGAAAGFSSSRQSISLVATRWAQRLTGVPVQDPMSGFFMLRRDVLESLAPKLSTEGFKILFDILVSSARRRLKVVELPYTFRSRLHGASKFDVRNALEFAALVLSELSGRRAPPHFFSFLFVGGVGVGVQLLCLRLGLAADLAFVGAEVVATFAAMTSNFFLNNALTYRDRRVGGTGVIPAILAFYAVCSIGALSNVVASSWLYSKYPVWWLAGLVGSVIAANWNFVGSSKFVWSRT